MLGGETRYSTGRSSGPPARSNGLRYSSRMSPAASAVSTTGSGTGAGSATRCTGPCLVVVNVVRSDSCRATTRPIAHSSASTSRCPRSRNACGAL